MGYKAFRDPEGRPWEVWLVLPTAAERRRQERRIAVANSGFPYTGMERRKTASSDQLWIWCRLANRVVKCGPQ